MLDTLDYLKHETNVWFEITTLLIPGITTYPAEIDALELLVDGAARARRSVPFHAFHPDWKMLDSLRPRHPRFAWHGVSRRMRSPVRVHGNMHDEEGQSTYCHLCRVRLIGRDWYDLPAGS